MRRRFAERRTGHGFGLGRSWQKWEALEKRLVLSQPGIPLELPNPPSAPTAVTAYEARIGDWEIRSQITTDTADGAGLAIVTDGAQASSMPSPGQTMNPDSQQEEPESSFRIPDFRVDPLPANIVEGVEETAKTLVSDGAVATISNPPAMDQVKTTTAPSTPKGAAHLFQKIFTGQHTVSRWSPILKLFDTNKPLEYKTWKATLAKSQPQPGGSE